MIDGLLQARRQPLPLLLIQVTSVAAVVHAFRDLVLVCPLLALMWMDECKECFKMAMNLEQTVKREAIGDPDLKPLWDSMGGAVWKRIVDPGPRGVRPT
jgi:hypothetical protein